MDKPKNVDEFIARNRAAVAANPECGTSHYNLAVGLLGQRKIEEAEQELLLAVECSPTLAEGYVQLGGIALSRGDLDACLRYNRHAINSRAGFSEGWGNIGFVHLQKGELDKAVYALEKAVKYNPKFIQARATLANAYLMQGNIREAIEASKKVLDFEPDFAVAHNNLAIAYLEDGNPELAKLHCDKAVELGYKVAPEIVREIDKAQ